MSRWRDLRLVLPPPLLRQCLDIRVAGSHGRTQALAAVKIGIIAEGPIDHTLLPPLFTRIAQDRKSISWPVNTEDVAERFHIRKRGHGGVLVALRVLVKALDAITRVSSRFDRNYGEGNVDMAADFGKNYWRRGARLQEIAQQCPVGYGGFEHQLRSRIRSQRNRSRERLRRRD